ncbi:protein phosphatase methylesterase 1 [Callorhinchus milii]|uniref:Protein phosphatase methylesterase 1 n=1 Tax=Callorhinchus milii TaxID=7868 RepID=V9KG54_CALMI|nr:protein phosphatase methylesterase 1 [Callorhinchus milii]XP_007889358.1 protein phosphatase methylesterase 1 [Callorhinchus milii]|eukprot:gi/632948006/ref/XP_007889357.1/ PREDICTED: protein phosphatase methylesterase 1 isoform X1 [Callorhinchus milii]
MSSLEKELLLNKLPSRPPKPTGPQPGSKARMGPGRKRDFSPVPWSQYFETMENITIENEEGTDSFRIYQSGSSGPVLLLLHGGGHSALSWAVFSSMITSRIHCRIVAVDLRGHGDTDVKDSENLSAEAMSRDIGNIVQSLYGANPPPIMLIGHSMGGAIAVHIAASILLPSLLALCVIDVVEGTAMDALNSMQTFLRSRPKSFVSVENAIEWSVKSGQIRNLESAKVSMAGQIKKCEGKYFISPTVSSMTIDIPLEEEDEEEDEEGQHVEVKRKEEPQPSKRKQIPEVSTNCVYTWRIDLAKTEKYWDGWFRGLSNLFLGCPIPKLLLLAGVDRLDRELTIGQMQGKFQMQVLPQCGHAVHEDDPDKVAEAIAAFLIRNKFTEAKGDI